MQNKNRNNQVYTEGQQSGKTDYPIASLLKAGKENAISTKELVRLSGCKSVRDLQECIFQERCTGAIICSGSGAGYWLPKNKEEIRKFCETMEKRARNTFNATKSARRALELPEGQLDITE